ncbi:YjcZ family sporulation protein [Paenibacillus sepulcri]
MSENLERGYVGGAFTSTGIILVLFILLVIIICGSWY